ncbi:MAG: CsgE family curli-type amyloid fiber assembly protein [Ketobacteraceae bacterium]|nr:CsgE family curli-type amyloid fiber assembly protein [Ketobacteraceae bacterium]
MALGIVAALLCSPAAFSGPAPIQGLVINQTESYRAQRFYQAFCLAWHEQRNASQFNVVLEETHSPRYGRQVQVLYDFQVAYIITLPSGNARIHALAEQAAAEAVQRIQGLALQQATYRDPDLATDEI